MPATLEYPVCLPWPQRAADRKEALATERGAEIDALKEKLTSARKDVGEARQRAGARSREDATLYVHLAYIQHTLYVHLVYNIHLPVSDYSGLQRAPRVRKYSGDTRYASERRRTRTLSSEHTHPHARAASQSPS